LSRKWSPEPAFSTPTLSRGQSHVVVCHQRGVNGRRCDHLHDCCMRSPNTVSQPCWHSSMAPMNHNEVDYGITEDQCNCPSVLAAQIRACIPT
jgi:hypothetical protein